MSMIEVSHVSMDYILIKDRTRSLKEFAIKAIKRDNHKEILHAIDDVDFHVESGEVIGIIGRNGAGKSTLLKIISGILKPTSGSVVVRGTVAPMLELGSGMDNDLSGRENIFLNGAILGFSKEYLEAKYEEIVAFSELEDFIDIPIRNYSSGMVMRLAFSIASMVVPDVLIVDEILSVGDECFQHKSKKRMLDLIHSGVTVLFVSHNIEQINSMCHRVAWLDEGRLRMLDSAYKVCQAYEESISV
jgi:ABC-2 type transport system ATP-binding protein